MSNSKEVVTSEQRLQERGKDYQAAIVRLWSAGIASFGRRWSDDYGEIDGMIFRSWAKSLCVSFEPETIRDRGPRILANWKGPHPPTLGQIRTELGATLPARTLSPAEERKELPRPRPSRAFIDRFLAEQERIARSPTSRIPGEEDVETFEESYRKLGLGRLMGSGGPKITR